MTKTFTATALAWLEYSSILDGSDLAQKYLGSCAVRSVTQGVTLPIWQDPVPTPITLQDLAVYASGLKPDGSPAWAPNVRTPAELFAEICTSTKPVVDFMDCAPGTDYAYVDVGWELLGTALANAHDGGSNYDGLLRRMLGAAALEMPDTVTILTGTMSTRLAPGYSYDKGYNLQQYEPGEWLICSTLQDMMQWLKFNMGEIPTSPFYPLLTQIHTPVTVVPGDGMACMGWFQHTWKSRDGHQIVRTFKNGVAEGFSSFIAFQTSSAPTTPVGVMVLTNQHGGVPGTLTSTVLQLLVTGGDTAGPVG